MSLPSLNKVIIIIIIIIIIIKFCSLKFSALEIVFILTAHYKSCFLFLSNVRLNINIMFPLMG